MAGYRRMRDTVDDLKRGGRLIVFNEPVDARLEIAEIQRRLYLNQAPAVLFTNVKGCRFPMLANLFGSLDQARYIFRHTIDRVRRAIELKIDPAAALQNPWRYRFAPLVALTMLPKKVRRSPVLRNRCELSSLPQLISWPDDGGAFITLPQVLSQSISTTKLNGCNLGMYRVQISGNQYQRDAETGLHYQLHRGIGVHHQEAIAANKPFRVNIFVGGSPAMTVAAVMPLPEGMSELTFAGALAGHRIPMITSPDHAPIYADADFCIVGEIDPTRLLPEGPFGDHLGYYAKQHDFPVLKVKAVYHRDDAIWPFTVVGRPPQEDTTFGELIHELTGPVVPTVLPGVKAVHAVDAAGVHPLLLAIGSERYTPYKKPQRPQELLTQASAILGQGQMSLAKYLLIIDQADNPKLDIHDIEPFLRHWLERIDFSRDLHFHTRTTIDTLDYSGHDLNQGSKVVMAAQGKPRRQLAQSPDGYRWPELTGFRNPRQAMPGVMLLNGPKYQEAKTATSSVESFCHALENIPAEQRPPLIILVDDSDFSARHLNNFLWTTFTRSNPANDISGTHAFIDNKHWGCRDTLVIDARIKPHHAPPLIEDASVTAAVDAIAARGGPLAKYL
jgi:4-hydroxy-3-polyprenylbenzoate decarboxylase